MVLFFNFSPLHPIDHFNHLLKNMYKTSHWPSIKFFPLPWAFPSWSGLSLPLHPQLSDYCQRLSLLHHILSLGSPCLFQPLCLFSVHATATFNIRAFAHVGPSFRSNCPSYCHQHLLSLICSKTCPNFLFSWLFTSWFSQESHPWPPQLIHTLSELLHIPFF